MEKNGRDQRRGVLKSVRRRVVRLPAVMAQLLLFSLLVFFIQHASGQVVVSSSSSNDSSLVPAPVPLQDSPTVTLSPTKVSPDTHSPLVGKDAPVSDRAEGLPGFDGGVGRRGGDEDFGKEQGGEETSDVEVLVALPEKQTQVQGNSSVSDSKDTEGTSQGSDASPSSAHRKNMAISSTAPSLRHPASSVSGMGQTQIPSASTAGLPVTVATLPPDQKRSNATQKATPLPSTNSPSDHPRSPNSTEREEAVTSGQTAWRPDRKAEEEYQQLPTVASTDNSTVILTTPGDGRAYVQSQGQTRSDAESAIVTKGPTSPAPPQVLQSLPTNPLPSTQSPDLQRTTYIVPTNSTITQPTVGIHMAGKGENSANDLQGFSRFKMC